jgi:hypothetical protein
MYMLDRLDDQSGEISKLGYSARVHANAAMPACTVVSAKFRAGTAAADGTR